VCQAIVKAWRIFLIPQEINPAESPYVPSKGDIETQSFIFLLMKRPYLTFWCFHSAVNCKLRNPTSPLRAPTFIGSSRRVFCLLTTLWALPRHRLDRGQLRLRRRISSLLRSVNSPADLAPPFHRMGVWIPSWELTMSENPHSQGVKE